MRQFWVKYLFVLVMFGSFCAYAQENTLSGHVYGANGEAAAFAHVLLLQNEDSVMVMGVPTDSIGLFVMKSIPDGNYLLNVSQLGYEPYFRSLSFSGTNDLTLERIELTMMSQQLEAVQVVGRKQLFQQKSDRLIINISSLPTFSGNNALQLLQKAPGVTVQENESSISLNNKGEVLIMINDRISRVPMHNLILQLKGMRAENIDRIELIHQPGARYDADNAAGIIHIVMKENNAYGLNGSASLTAGMGQREKLNGSVDLNYRNNGLNVYGNATGFNSRSPIALINHFREYDYQGDQFYYENNFKFDNPINRTLGFNLGVDFEINKFSTIGGLFGYSKNTDLGSDYTSRSKGTVNAVPNTNSQYLLNIDNPSRNTFINLNYFRKIGDKGSLNIDVDRVNLDVQNSSELTYLDIQATKDKTAANRESKFEINTVKADFEWGTNAGVKVETGVKGTFNNSNTRSRMQNNIAGMWEQDEAFTANDNISEKILAAYASHSKKWDGKWETNLGLRLEHYNYALDDGRGENDFNLTYNNLFPVLRTSYVIDSTRSLNLAFNRRIERPSYYNLAGFYVLIDPTLFASSNTRIRPSFTNAYRLTYNYGYFLIAVEINRTVGAIAFYNTVDKERNLQISIPTNFDQMDGYLINISFPIKIDDFWDMNWNLDGAYKKVIDASNRPLPFEKGLFTFTAQLSNSFDLGNSWTANIDGRYMSPFIDGDQVKYLHHYINFGLSKKFKNERLLTFSVQDVTATSGFMEWEYNQTELGIRTFGNNDFSERVFQLTFFIPFGNQKVKVKRNRETGSQEERNRM
ncbi:TonB-dependent receptor [Cyclobacterium sp. 1_MG-2023]|uniref:TonB-dependent receptor n=1 Tax=Cyclobacterium sp. 1_MG-2023 TaxID=3062681 RepID=UPI0026E27E27|nr:TonB-dependent receptor [Cyclobacterium sp. 1_MG-2023]MDO6436648.1 TonB-dependent receptor [Cyclobacterium sp. 1_MG-2023]